MKIFIDTADLDEIKMACSWGIVDGATTNPSLIKRAVDRRKGKVAMDEYIKEIVKTVPGPVSLEVIALKADEMIEQAETLHEKFSPHGNVVIKIPINPNMDERTYDFDGLKAIKKLNMEGIPVNATLIMTPEQALLAAKAGAAYASPFAGRIDDYIRTKLGLRRTIDFQKGDYFDSDIIQNMLKRRLGMNKDMHSILETYINEYSKLISSSHDKGVYSGLDLIQKILKIYRNYGYKTKIIVASIRNARQVREVSEAGADIATIPVNIIKEMIQHDKTLEGIKAFSRDVVPAYEGLFKKRKVGIL